MGRGRRSCGLVVASVLAGIVPAACGEDGEKTSCPERPTEVVEERAVAVSHQGPTLDVASGPTPGLVVQVTSSQPSVERVRISLDGEEALDVDLPAAANCWGGHDPVFSVLYDLPPGPVEAELHIQGASSTRTIDVPATGTAWAVVDVQSQREWGDIQLYDTRPEWG